MPSMMSARPAVRKSALNQANDAGAARPTALVASTTTGKRLVICADSVAAAVYRGWAGGSAAARTTWVGVGRRRGCTCCHLVTRPWKHG